MLEDAGAVRQTLSNFFADRQWAPVQAGFGEEAPVQFGKQQPAAAIVDECRPRMDGDEIIRDVRQTYRRASFAACSGSPENMVLPGAQDLGCISARLLKKPVIDLTQRENTISVL